MGLRVVVTVNHEQLSRKLRAASVGLVGRTLAAATDHARAFAPKDTGRLAARTDWKLTVVGRDKVTGQLTSDTFYAHFFHTGTGIYGPTGQPIVPRRAKMLRFPWKKMGGRIVYARSVKGMPANDYLVRGLRTAIAGEPEWKLVIHPFH